MDISTKALSLLPDILTLRAISQSLALLDAILSPVWEYRYYSFNAHWAAQQALASMRNGQGDSYLAWFSPNGVVLKGFAHESLMSPYRVNPPQLWPGILDGFPTQFSSFLSEVAFVIEETTFCVWRSAGSVNWQSGSIQFPDGPDPDGSAQLLKLLDSKPQSYQQWAEAYYERPVDLPSAVHIYEQKSLTDQVVSTLNPSLSIQDLALDLTEIGYGS